MTHQHSRAKDGGGRIGDAFAGDIRRRPVNWFGNRHFLAQIDRRRQAEAAAPGRRHIRQNIAIKIGRQHDVKAGRLLDHPIGGRIHQQFISLDVFIISGDLIGHPPEQAIRLRHDIAFVDNRDSLPHFNLRQPKSHAGDSFGRVTGYPLGRHAHIAIFRRLLIANIKVFGVFPHHDQIHTRARRRHRQIAGRPQVGVGFHQPPQLDNRRRIARHRIGGRTAGPKQDRLRFFCQINRCFGERVAGIAEDIPAGRGLDHLKFRQNPPQDLHGRRHDFAANAIAFNHT